jgi:hypothetical protein
MNATFASRRATSASSISNTAWGRNRNAVRHEPRVSLGPVSHTITILLLVLVVGLIYLTQAAKVTSYDHEIASTDGEIATLQAERDSLAVENAKITAAAAGESNEVATTMADANTGHFVAE